MSFRAPHVESLAHFFPGWKDGSTMRFCPVPMAKRNAFTREYHTGRKDQYDLDYAIFRKAIDETVTRDELVKYIDEKFGYVIAKIAEKNGKAMIQQMLEDTGRFQIISDTNINWCQAGMYLD